MMKKLKVMLFTFLLAISASASAQVAVFSEEAISPNGQYIVRFHNASNFWVSCWYRDQANYITFSIAPMSPTNWQPVFGVYQWQCNFV